MRFDTLLGNDRLKQNLTESLARGHISHCYLISGPRGSGKHTLAALLSAAILCREGNKPCLRCSACRKVLEGSHPDCITVDDPEKKTVTVDLIRQARADIYIQPNEADRKLYIFPRAQDMGVPGQNALLKILEEPPPYGVFLLLTENPDKLLPTVRSRCRELKMQALPEPMLLAQLRRDFPEAAEADLQAAAERSGGWLGQARELLEGGAQLSRHTEDFLRALAARDDLLLAQTLASMEKWKREELLQTLQSWLELTESALACRGGISAVSGHARLLSQARSAEELYGAVLLLKQCLNYTMSNVSPGAVCAYLRWELK